MKISAKIGRLAASTLILGGFVFLPGSGSAEGRIGSGIENAPDFVLPDVVDTQADTSAEVGGETTSGQETGADAADPAAQLLGVIRKEISDKYADGEVDPTRLSRLVDGSYMTDYVKGSPTDGPVQFSNSFFDTSALATPEAGASEVPAPASGVAPAPAASLQPAASAGQVLPADQAFQQFMMTPEGMQAIAGMSQDQIRGIAYLMQAMSGKAMPPAQAGLNGIPGLEDKDIAAIDPEELLRQAAAAQAPRVVEVGDGKTLGLADWVARLSPDGLMQIENTLIAGSAIDVAEGMVIGQFGRIAKIVSTEAESYVEFETGDRILGKAPVVLSHAVPGLEDELAPDTASDAAREAADQEASGEIIISIAAPRPKDQPIDPAAAGSVAAKVAVADFRPEPRPATPAHAASAEASGAAIASGKAVSEAGTAQVAVAADLAPRLRPRPRPAHLAKGLVTAPPGDQEPAAGAPDLSLAHEMAGTDPSAPAAFRPLPKPLRADTAPHGATGPLATAPVTAQATGAGTEPGLFRPKPRPRRG